MWAAGSRSSRDKRKIQQLALQFLASPVLFKLSHKGNNKVLTYQGISCIFNCLVTTILLVIQNESKKLLTIS